MEVRMKYKSDILEVIHQSAIDKFEIGAISKTRMREYDEMCLAEEKNDTNTFFLENENRQRTELVTA
jgi:DNA-binding transcriptional regulator YiaG